MKKILIIVLCVTIACAAVIALALAPKLINMKSEYVTAGVIRDTHAFVKTHQGQWPTSWSDLGSEDFSSYTRMRFDLDPLSATKEQVMSAISPQSGKYLTYPHAEADLEALFEELMKQRREIRTSVRTVPD
jgi:hypothetical protein